MKCMSGCPGDIKLFGTKKYEETSQLCVSAYHSGSINKDGGEFTLSLSEADRIYKSSESNGKRSRMKKGKYNFIMGFGYILLE